jgi:hypothetical protein
MRDRNVELIAKVLEHHPKHLDGRADQFRRVPDVMRMPFTIHQERHVVKNHVSSPIEMLREQRPFLAG